MFAATKQTEGPARASAGLSHRRAMVLVGLVAVVAGSAAYLLGAWPSLENASVDLRFSLRPAKRPSDVVLVAVDDTTLNALQQRWPFPRSLDAHAVEVLHADHARTIVYDVQFTQPTTEREDLELYDAIAHSGNVVLATTEIGPGGTSNVLGGEANLATAHARAAASSVAPNSSNVIQKYPYSIEHLKTLAVVAAEQATGYALRPAMFEHGSAWIDYRGGVGTVPSVSFSDLVEGKVNPARIAGKVVVIGATSPVLQDIHATSTAPGGGMPGPEVQANAIWTALHGNPLHEAPGWLTLLTIALAAAVTPLLSLRMSAPRAFGLGALCAGGYALATQAAFDTNLILVVTYPLIALAAGALGALIVSYGIESWERQLAEVYGATLEATVGERTSTLKATQLEAIRRLAQAAELKDEDTGLHIERIGRTCEALALEVGISSEDAERLRIASALHDVGKIGIPDRILLKPGKLDAREWEIMKTHTSTGAEILSHSDTDLFQLAETIARTHHERWDGTGYPLGLRGAEIPLAGRICAICDVFDALSSRRPYKEAWPFDLVVAEIVRERGTHFDPVLVDAFLKNIAEFERAHAQASSQAATDNGEPTFAREIEARYGHHQQEPASRTT